MSETQRTAEEIPLPGGDFRLFVTRLSFQGMLSLGLLENPITKTKHLNLHGARMIVDDHDIQNSHRSCPSLPPRPYTVSY